MKQLFATMLILCSLALALPAWAASTGGVETHALTTTDGTVPHEVKAEVVSYLGREAVHVTVPPTHKGLNEGGKDNNCFLLVTKDGFHNGVIELDVAGKPSLGAPAWARGFVGVVFRVDQAMDAYEGFYLRPMNALEEGPRRNFSAQYFSFPDHTWNQLREAFPGKYEAYAPVTPGEWTSLRLEIQGASARFFANGELVLTVDEMFGGADMNGGIGLFTEPVTDAYFSNLRITHSK